ncbi:MAG: DUF2232 domain-containing protein [Gemmatimonadota bacterium]
MKRNRAVARAALLALAASLVSPIGVLWLVSVPLGLALVALRWGERWPTAGAGVLLGSASLYALAVALVGGGDAPLRFAELGWCLLVGGAFVAASASGTGRTLMDRTLIAVGGAGGVVLVIGLLRPGLVSGLDWAKGAEIRQTAAAAYTWLAANGGAWVERFGAAMLDWVAFQEAVYPAFLALGSLAALGVAGLLGEGPRRRVAPGRIRDFRFSDQLVWILVAGLALLVLPLGRSAARVGENATLFMGVLYLVRGGAVLWWIAASVVTSAGTGVLLALLAMLLYPVVAGTALVVGLSDTWLDLRGRMRRSEAEDGAP